jgi:Ca-activated chloride channel family protein
MRGGFVFDNPWILTGMVIIIPLALSDLLSPLRRRIRGKLPSPLKIKLFASRLFFCLFLCLLICALAGPRWGREQARNEYRRAVDVVIAVDVSRSMLVPDGGYDSGRNTDRITRLKQGTSIVREAVAALPGTRFAVAVSRNRGIVAIPLTWDDGAVLAFLETIDGSSLTGRGTNLESLLDAGAGAFQSSSPSNRVILLVSDGEALSGSIRAALSRCNRDDIAVTSILTGSDEGAPVPGGGVQGGEDTISRRDAAAMRMAAGQTGGIFIDANREDAADILISHLRSLAVETESPRSSETNKERWVVFVLLAIMAYGLSKASLLNLVGRK